MFLLRCCSCILFSDFSSHFQLLFESKLLMCEDKNTLFARLNEVYLSAFKSDDIRYESDSCLISM